MFAKTSKYQYIYVYTYIYMHVFVVFSRHIFITQGKYTTFQLMLDNCSNLYHDISRSSYNDTFKSSLKDTNS